MAQSPSIRRITVLITDDEEDFKQMEMKQKFAENEPK